MSDVEDRLRDLARSISGPTDEVTEAAKQRARGALGVTSGEGDLKERPPERRRRLGKRGLLVLAGAIVAGSATAVAIQSSGAPGDSPPERAGVHFPGAERDYNLPVPALNGASPDGYTTVAEADGIIAVEQRKTAPGKRCVVIASVSGATTRGCWEGGLKPGVLVWAFDELDGSQAVAFGTDTRAASARVGQRSFPVPAGSDIAVTRLQKGEYLPIRIQHGSTAYTVAFPGGTAPR